VSGGLTCRDFDTEQAYQQWATKHKDLSIKLPTSKTSRGYHVFFLSDFNGIKNLKDGEIRGERAYLLLPPSTHPNGIKYKWLISPDGDIPELSLSDFDITGFTEESDESDDIEAISSNIIASLSSVSSLSSLKYRIILLENLDEKVQVYVNTAIKRTLPDKKGYRNFLIFQFCRWLKGHTEFEQCAAGQLKPLVRLWHKRALPAIGTKSFDDTWADFCYGWKRVKYPKGGGTLKLATQKALEAQNHIPAEDNYGRPEIKLLVRLCFELQELQKSKSFWLSWNDAAPVLVVSVPTAGKWLSMLEADGIIATTEEHTAIKATRYKYIAL
jgi:hypothetical protein